MPYPISNAHAPYNNVDPTVVNVDNSHPSNIAFSSNTIPDGPHTMAPAGSNVQGAAGIYPCAQKGGKNRRSINRSKINKISRKYKMKGSKRSRHVKRMKSRMRSRYSRKMRGGNCGCNQMTKYGGRMMKHGSRKSRRMMRGGIAMAPNYPGGHLQFDNNKVLSNTFATGGPLAPTLSALATPPTIHKLAPQVDNLNHAAPNAYGNYGAGSGFPSRGWF
jgi:hypothetical protein